MNAEFEYKTMVFNEWKCENIDGFLNAEAMDGWLPFKTQFEYNENEITAACILFQREVDDG